jgi:hypothetical protein
MTTVDRHRSQHTGATAPRVAAWTAWLLACGAAAGPLFALVAVAEAVTRTGFDIVRNPISQLSDGSLGWIQIANFVVYGALTVAGSRGLASALAGTPGGRWAPRLVGIGGTAILIGGCFRLDPGNGFPAGAPAGQPKTMSWHSYVHLAGGGIGFITLIAACFVIGHHYARSSRPRAALGARLSAFVFVAGYVWSMAGGAGGPLTLCIGVLTGMLCVSATALAVRQPTRRTGSRAAVHIGD